MSLAQRLAAEDTRKCGSFCLSCDWTESLSDDDRDAIERWLDDGGSVTSLHRMCREEGLPVQLTAFKVHVREHVRR